MFRLKSIIVFCGILLGMSGKGWCQDTLMTKYLNKLKTVSTDTGKVMLLCDIASRYFEYDLDKVNAYGLQAKALSERAHFNKGLGRSLVNIAGYNIRLGRYELANNDLGRALPLLQQACDTNYMIRLYNSISAINLSLNHIENVFEYDKKALDLARKSKDKKNELMILLNMCNSYVVLKDYNKGIAYGQMALKEARRQKSEKDSAYIYDDLGLCYTGLGQYDTGRYYFFHSLAIDEKLGYERHAVVCLTNIAESYANENNRNQALRYYEMALAKATALKNIQYISLIQSSLGQIHAHYNEYKAAIPYFIKCIDGLKQTQDYYSLSENYLHLSESYSALKDYKNAYQSQILYAGIKDSLAKSANQAGIKALESKYEIKKKQDEIELLKMSKDLKDTRYQRQRLMFFGFIAGGLLVFILIIILINRARIKQRMKLQQHTAELEKKALQLQMNPHFIFNALGSISGFIASNDKINALKYLARFSRLIRYTLESSVLPTVSLNQEIENLENYLELEKMRFNHKFNYIITVNDDLSDNYKIPPMVIQPFLENAILHGVTPNDRIGLVRISFAKDGEKVICTVEDDGIGRQKAAEMQPRGRERQSMGIEITRKRLSMINSDNEFMPSVNLEDLYDLNQRATGTRVTILFNS